MIPGEEHHAGDGGYEESTWEKHNAFVAERNYPLPPNCIQFMIQPNSKVVLRISREGIWANPDVPVDETAQRVLQALENKLAKKPWVSLTDTEKQNCIFDEQGFVVDYEDCVARTEAKLKEKNA